MKTKSREKPKKILKSGMVSIVGRPNVGKSTLLNNIVGEKVAIVSKVPQTTRNQIRGIYNDERGQIVFIDTPGVHVGNDKLDQMMNNASTSTLDESDCVVYLVDTSRRIGQEEQFIAEKVAQVKKPVIMALNKVDLKAEYLSEYIAFWERIKGKPINEIKNFTMIALSGQNGTNVDELLDIVFNEIPKGPALYPTDVVTDLPQKIAIADIIREKFLVLLREELPHSLGVMIEEMRNKRRGVVVIRAVIFIERPSQKEIVIGKKGHVLKEVGTQARKELEEFLEQKVFLELFVKAKEDWRDDLSVLQELGYQQFS
jgi:GTP-binding protein Era